MALTWKSGGGGGDAVLTADLTVSNPIGKLTQGQVLAAGTTLEYIDREMLMKTYYPTLTPPSVNATWDAPALLKVGASAVANIRSVFSRGRIDPANGTSGYRSGEVTGFTLVKNGTDAGTSADGSFTDTVTRATKGTETYKVRAAYAAGEQPKDSEGNNYDHPLGAGDVSSADLKAEFIYPFYYGATDSTPRTDLTGLSEHLAKKGNQTFTVATNSEYVTFVYDAAYGNLRSIRDEGDQENIDGYTKSTITVDGVAYNMYVSQFLTVDPAAVYRLSF